MEMVVVAVVMGVNGEELGERQGGAHVARCVVGL